MRYLLIGLLGFLTLGIVYSCQKELSVEYGSAAKGSLQSTAGDCLPKTVGGSYIAAKILNDSNFIDVTVNVTSPGPYTIFTDTVNGYAFKATGTFSNTGATTVRLKGSGTPASSGADDFTVYFDSSYCDVIVPVLPAGSTGGAATFTLAGAPGACGSFTPFGNFIKDTVLDNRHYVKVDVNVTAVGTYSITTNTVNGYSFSGTGTFGTTGTQTVILQGAGKPLAAGTNAFTVTAGTSTCTFSITVTATAVQSCNANVQGTYTTGTAVTAANKVTFSHTYATAGNYTITTNTTNGLSFAPFTVNATAGANTITLNATGTPTASGTSSFTIDFGDGQTCSFTVTVVGVPNTDYFPTTQGSYWTYDDVPNSDTFKVTVSGTTTISGNTYQNFVYSDATGTFGTEYYRKDPATNFYYQSVDTTGSGFGQIGVIFSQAKFDILFLKNALVTGAGWNWDVPATILGTPSTVRFKYACVDGNATVTINGKTFSNVYKVQQIIQVNFGGWQDVAGPYTFYYAKGIGLLSWEDDLGAPQQNIRYWQVN